MAFVVLTAFMPGLLYDGFFLLRCRCLRRRAAAAPSRRGPPRAFDPGAVLRPLPTPAPGSRLRTRRGARRSAPPRLCAFARAHAACARPPAHAVSPPPAL